MQNLAKKISQFLLKSFAFTAIFWLTCVFVFKPFFLSAPSAVPTFDAQEARQSEIYSQQLQKANEQLSVVTQQQKRLDAVLVQQEQQIKRYDAVLLRWEQQTGIRK